MPRVQWEKLDRPAKLNLARMDPSGYLRGLLRKEDEEARARTEEARLKAEAKAAPKREVNRRKSHGVPIWLWGLIGAAIYILMRS